MEDKKRDKFNKRGFATFVVTLSFLLMLVSGVVLYLTPAGRIARGTGWALLGMDKWQWAAVHTTTSILFLLCAVLHLLFNWRIFINYFRTKMEEGFRLKREFGLALVVAGLFVAGTLLNLPPFSKVTEVREEMKLSGDQTGSGVQPGQGRGGGSGRLRSAGRTGNGQEDLSLREGLPEEAAQQEGREAPVSAAPAAEAPGAIHEDARPGGGARARPEEGRGYGRMNIEQFCAARGLQTETVLASLRKLGVQATGRSSLRLVASELGTTPGKFYEVLQKAQ